MMTTRVVITMVLVGQECSVQTNNTLFLLLLYGYLSTVIRGHNVHFLVWLEVCFTALRWNVEKMFVETGCIKVLTVTASHVCLHLYQTI